MTRKPRTAPSARARSSQAIRTARIMRRVAIAGAIPVGAVALWVSYWHIHDVTMAAGEDTVTARTMALSVDGLMLTAAVAIMAGRRSVMPYLAFGFGLAASLAANIISADAVLLQHAADGSAVSYIVAGWPAVSLTLTGELLLRLLVPAKAKPRRRAPAAKTIRKQSPAKRTSSARTTAPARTRAADGAAPARKLWLPAGVS